MKYHKYHYIKNKQEFSIQWIFKRTNYLFQEILSKIFILQEFEWLSTVSQITNRYLGCNFFFFKLNTPKRNIYQDYLFIWNYIHSINFCSLFKGVTVPYRNNLKVILWLKANLLSSICLEWLPGCKIWL